jgi:outer membrane murein-binding lipoprotein Lpp
VPIPNLNNYRNNAVDLINSLETSVSTLQSGLSTTESDVTTLQSDVAALQPKNIRTTSSADQTISAGVLTILDFDTTQYSTGTGDFTVSSDGRITVKNSGVYSMTCGTVVEAEVGALDTYNISLLVNGEIVASSGSYADLAVGNSISLDTSTQFSLSADDIVDARFIVTQVVNGVGNGLIRNTRTLFGLTATQVNHLAISKVG